MTPDTAMTLEDLIYNRLTGPDGPAEKLARYGGKPAVFYQTAPDDTKEEWGTQPQYPRIDYVVDMQANPERHTSGVMTLNIWSSNQSIPPEDIEPDVQRAFRDVFFTPDDSPPFSLSWFKSSAFAVGGKYPATTIRKEPDTMVMGMEMTFEVYAFPQQETTDPDPILAMNAFAKAHFPGAVVIGTDTMPVFRIASEEHPALYFRLMSLRSAEETNMVAWMEGVIAGHIFAPEQVRMRWLRELTDMLAYHGEVIMLDGSPMFLKNIRADSGADALTVGQLRLTVRFGLLRRWPYAHPLADAHMDYPNFETRRNVTWKRR